MSEKSIGQIAYEAWEAAYSESEIIDDPCSPTWPWEEVPSESREWNTRSAKAVLAHAAKLLREQGERENSYVKEDCFEKAARILEELK